MLVPLVGGAVELRFDDESRLEKLALDGRGFPEDEIEIDGDTEQLVAMDALHTFVEGEKQESGRAENASELSHRLPQLCRIEMDDGVEGNAPGPGSVRVGEREDRPFAERDLGR